MKATLYEALGVPQLAPDEEVRAALRRLIRKYYAKTRDGQGNVEEALRFINHASRILSDPEHRQHYDKELAVTGEANTEQRISRFVSNVAGTVEQGNIAHAARTLGINRSTLYYRLRKHGLEHLLPRLAQPGHEPRAQPRGRLRERRSQRLDIELALQ